MDRDHAVLHFAATAQPLPRYAHGLIAALGRSRFIQATNRLGVEVVADDESLALVANARFIPLDRFEQPLERSRRRAELQGDGLHGLTTQIGKQSPDVNHTQSESRRRAETMAKQPEEGVEFLADPSDLG